MQIHELTQKRRVNEASLGGVWSGIKTAAQGVGAVATGIGKELVGGIDPSPQDRSMGPESEQRARAAAKSMIPVQAATNEKLWNQAVASVMKETGVPSAAQLDSASRQRLTTNLLNQLHSNFLQKKIKDYKQLADKVEVPQPPSQTPAAPRVVQAIETAINQIASLENIGKPAASKQDWLELATAAYDALTLLQFHPKAGTEQAAQGRIVADPQTDAILRAASMDANTLTRLNAAVKKSGGPAAKATGNSAIDGLLRAARLL